MSYFDNANTNVTRKSFGSKVDKTFQREGVVPIKDRKKDEKDIIAESAKYNELNKKVEGSRLEALKETRAYETQLKEGYKKVKDNLIKDFLSEICVESLLVDRDIVDNNLKNIVFMVENQIDDLGGFEGIKRIAESNQNPVLLNIVNMCEEMSQEIGERVVTEAKGCAKNINFNLTKQEMNDYDYKKKEIGSDTIINAIKDKVFQVVQDEQQQNADRQEIMSEIEGKIQELNGPVQEAMDFVFNKAGVEETTLFDSLMRSHYSQLLESNSSVIFESLDVQIEEEPLFEEQEFVMKDIELVDDEDIKEKMMDEEDEPAASEDENIENDPNVNLIESLHSNSIEELEEKIEQGLSRIVEAVNEIKVKSEAKARKSEIRSLQDAIDNYILEHLEVNEEENNDEEMINESSDSNDIDQLFAAMEAKCGKKVKEGCDECEDDDDEEIEVEPGCDEEDGCEYAGESKCGKGKKKCKEAAAKEEVILCPDCGKEVCVCKEKPAKESSEIVEEGLIKNAVVNMMSSLVKKSVTKKISQRDFESVRQDLTKMVGKESDINNIKMLRQDVEIGIKELQATMDKYPEKKEDLATHIKWLKTDYQKMLDDREKYLRGEKLQLESFVEKLEDICESLNTIIDAHDVAYNNVLESMLFDINDTCTMVPYLQAKDCELSNLEFAYKTKLVCESLKAGLKSVKENNELSVIVKAIEMNISSINETLEAIKENTEMSYKVKTLQTGKKYLEKLQEVATKNTFEEKEIATESTSLFSTPEEVEKIFNSVKEYYVIESTNNDTMELVMAEAIVDYTILEAFNTLNLMKFDKDVVRQMARKNLSK